MGSELPKQFLPIGGKPVLMHTLQAFYDYDRELRIILVLPASQQAYWAQLCREHHFTVPHEVADGGETRFHSVKNALERVNTSGLVGVHDGVRPFVSQEVIARCYEQAAEKKAVVPVVNVVAPICWFLLAAWMMSVQYCDYPYDNHKIPFADMRHDLSMNRLCTFAFGAVIALAMTVPVLNLLIPPAAVCAGTKYYVELRKRYTLDSALRNPNNNPTLQQ